MTMPEILGSFACESLFEASGKLLKHLGVKCSTQTEEPIPFLELYEDAAKDAGAEVPKPIKKVFARVDKTYFIGTVDDDTLGGSDVAVDFAAVAEKPKYEGMFVFAVQMKSGEALTRTEASLITRGINRIVKQMPATVIILEDSQLSIATCERTQYRQTWRPGEKLGRVSILKGINCLNPHRGHLDILESMNVKKAKTFDALYKQWKDVFSSKLLTKQFYREIQNWYFWALKKEQHVSFPNALDDDADDELFNSENMIRLITRLIFTWFMKEKQLVNPELFKPEFLSKVLKYFNAEGAIDDPKAKDADKSCTYYRAVLQNLFFATFNQEIKMRDFVETQVRDSKRYNIKNYYRNAKLFTETDKQKIIAYFNGSPFVNGGLFECLDNVEQNGRVYSWDGFSNSVRYQDGSLKSALIPDRLFFGGETTTDLSEFFEKDKSAKSVKVRGIINILNDYVFTIEENTPLDEDVALDPELLGKVFENLLGCYNPETQQMARNSTGSFYTPREIVNYMVRVSLRAYLKRKCPKVDPREIDALVNGTAELDQIPTVKANAKEILTALFKVKILDPACGSGAFPMGIMLTIVDVLRKIDPDNRYWYEIVLKESLAEAENVADVGDEQERAELKAQIEYDFKERMDHPDYARKLYVIEHCIFGGDIQPIAVQISRLRFFITLLCEQTRTDDPDTNYGITPLPNLENNFVAANSLLSIDLKDMRELLGQKKIIQLVKQLRAVRHQLFLPKTSDKKKRLQRKDEELRAAIAAAAEGLYDENVEQKSKLYEAEIKRCEEELSKLSDDDFKTVTKEVVEVNLLGEKTVTTKKVVGKGNEYLKRKSSAEDELSSLKNASRKERLLTDLKRLVAWNPFAFNIAEKFLDPEWMFGVKEGFDIVIGNPPYIKIEGLSVGERECYRENYKTFYKRYDTFGLFTEAAVCRFSSGIVSFIMPSVVLTNLSFAKLRDLLLDNKYLQEARYLGGEVFDSATVDTSILVMDKRGVDSVTLTNAVDWESPSSYSVPCDYFQKYHNVINLGDRETQMILDRVFCAGHGVVSDHYIIYQGVVTGNNNAFIFDDLAAAKDAGIEPELLHSMCHGRDVSKWVVKSLDRQMLYVNNEVDIQQYPGAYKWLQGFRKELEKSHDNDNPWYTLHRPRERQDLDTVEKIVVQNTRNESLPVRIVAALDSSSVYGSQGVNFIIPRKTQSLKVLLAILNSKLVNYIFRTKFLNLAIKAEYLKQLPFPAESKETSERLTHLVEGILSAKQEDGNADTSALEAEIDNIVFDLYGLTAEERALVEGAGK